MPARVAQRLIAVLLEVGQELAGHDLGVRAWAGVLAGLQDARGVQPVANLDGELRLGVLLGVADFPLRVGVNARLPARDVVGHLFDVLFEEGDLGALRRCQDGHARRLAAGRHEARLDTPGGVVVDAHRDAVVDLAAGRGHEVRLVEEEGEHVAADGVRFLRTGDDLERAAREPDDRVDALHARALLDEVGDLVEPLDELAVRRLHRLIQRHGVDAHHHRRAGHEAVVVVRVAQTGEAVREVDDRHRRHRRLTPTERSGEDQFGRPLRHVERFNERLLHGGEQAAGEVRVTHVERVLQELLHRHRLPLVVLQQQGVGRFGYPALRHLHQRPHHKGALDGRHVGDLGVGDAHGPQDVDVVRSRGR